ncbi:MAG: hypothetical protein JWN99_1369 [Ilumatobacteraceae bacterium]|nr:hypothetical protein [Ilumatobacteraceae bacterium]
MRHVLTRIVSIAAAAAAVTSMTACGGSDAVSAPGPSPLVTSPGQTTLVEPPSAAGTIPAIPTTDSPVGGGVIASEPSANTVGSAAAPAQADTGLDPCALLTASVAAAILAQPVGESITQPGEGNTTCGYRPADPAAQGFVSLTLYSVAGTEAVLDAAASGAFPDAKAVDGVGDAARVSMQGQAIGVLTGRTVFALGVFPQAADGQLLPVTEDQLIAAAHAVLDGQ